jgi:hypothetical protein
MSGGTLELRALPIAILAAIFFVACTAPARPPAAAGPVEAAQEFSAALQRGDTGAAWGLVSSRAQREADQLAAKARAAAGGTTPESGRQMLMSSALPQGKVKVRELGRDSPDSARVEVTSPSGQPREFRMVREGQSWKVDLDLAKG